MEQRFVLHCEDFSGGKLTFDVGYQQRGIVDNLFKKSREKHGGYFSVKLNMPYVSRTTGRGSQNHHLNGHIMQICNETGNSYDAVKNEVKMIAAENLGYPYEEFRGRIVPKGEHECNTEECAKLIEAAHLLAADLEMILIEE